MSEEIDNLFIDEPYREISVRECARLCKISPSTASKYLHNLAKDGFLKLRKERNIQFYSANIDSEIYRDIKVFENIRRIRNSGLLDLLNTELYTLTIFLFGSYAKGENRKESDIDIFIITNRKKELDMTVYKKKLQASIQLFLYTPEEIKKLRQTNPHLINNVLNGIRLSGFWEVF